MPIDRHPNIGSIIWCDFSQGFSEPEMVKRRPVVVLSPRIMARPRLCTVVALSTTDPIPKMDYHVQIDIHPPLPPHFTSNGVWVKGDMVYSVGFHRLDLIRLGKDSSGRRIYYDYQLNPSELKKIRECILRAMGMAHLTKHL